MRILPRRCVQSGTFSFTRDVNPPPPLLCPVAALGEHVSVVMHPLGMELGGVGRCIYRYGRGEGLSGNIRTGQIQKTVASVSVQGRHTGRWMVLEGPATGYRVRLQGFGGWERAGTP